MVSLNKKVLKSAELEVPEHSHRTDVLYYDQAE
jgi:hypothetical protein